MRTRLDRRYDRQEQAKARQKNWDGLSLASRLRSLDERLGVGVGAVRQRKRLADAILAQQTRG